MKKGFTLVELLAVIAVLGILTVVVAPNVLSSLRSSKETAMKVQENDIADSANSYIEDYCSKNAMPNVTCPSSYTQSTKSGYICIKDLESYFSGSITYNGQSCDGIVVFTDGKAKTYILCSDNMSSGKYSYITDGASKTDYQKCGLAKIK